MTRVTIFDYGAGNLHSLAKAVARTDLEQDALNDVEVRIDTDPIGALDTDVLILPGVGAFGAAAERLAPGLSRMREAILQGLPAIGICLGMQLLFDQSEEAPGAGLGVIPGHVRRLRADRVPHIGWNDVTGEDINRNASTRAFPALPIAYFAHSFVCEPNDPSTILARTTHEGDTFASVVRIANAIGVQFHPEKSSSAGVTFLRRWIGTLKTSHTSQGDTP